MAQYAALSIGGVKILLRRTAVTRVRNRAPLDEYPAQGASNPIQRDNWLRSNHSRQIYRLPPNAVLFHRLSLALLRPEDRTRRDGLQTRANAVKLTVDK